MANGFILVKNIVMPSGKTVEEENLEKQHKIPIDTLVEVDYCHWFGGGACMVARARLWVIAHGRDCDGEPLYTLADVKSQVLRSLQEEYKISEQQARLFYRVETGFMEEALKVIEVTPELEKGIGALTVDDLKK